MTTTKGADMIYRSIDYYRVRYTNAISGASVETCVMSKAEADEMFDALTRAGRVAEVVFVGPR